MKTNETLDLGRITCNNGHHLPKNFKVALTVLKLASKSQAEVSLILGLKVSNKVSSNYNVNALRIMDRVIL